MSTQALLTGVVALLLATGTAHATEDFCAVVLKPPVKVVRDKEYNSDAWLALRDGPGMQFMVMGKLREGDFLWADTATCQKLNEKWVCDDKHEWTHIVGIPKFDGPPNPNTKTYSQGWVRSKYIQEFACESEQANSPPSLPPPDIQVSK
jgi:hypothetical protein